MDKIKSASLIYSDLRRVHLTFICNRKAKEKHLIEKKMIRIYIYKQKKRHIMSDCKERGHYENRIFSGCECKESKLCFTYSLTTMTTFLARWALHMFHFSVFHQLFLNLFLKTFQQLLVRQGQKCSSLLR